ncbi:MAG: 23S rRNA (guanosine(2251)-2'-O)-methyltransferase RlmB [Bacteroidota bacterium]
MNTIIAGRKPIIEALKAGTRIERIVFLTGVQGRVINDIRSLAERKHVPVSHANKQQFCELATNATTQGVVAIVPTKRLWDVDRILEVPAEKGEKGFLLLLDEIEDPHNLGALIRTAECAGVHGVVVPKHHAAPVTTTVIKAAAGATEHMAMGEVTNLVNFIEQLKSREYWIVGLDATAPTVYTEADYATAIALVVGNEGKGIRRLVREHCDHVVKIPVYGKIGSLNASVAGGLVMYEVARRRREATAPQN